MKAVICSEYGDPAGLALETIEAKPLKDSEVRIEVHACGINFPDVLMVQGKHQLTPKLPFCPGGEVAGIVREVAPDVTAVAPGERVMAVTFWGGLAEQVNAPLSSVVVIPDEMDFATAAVFQGGNAVAYYALKRRGALQAGENLLVLGAAGGVGTAAVQVGKAMGARVIALVSSPEKAAAALRNGADDAVNYTTEDVRGRLKALTNGRGVDVIFDPVGGAPFDDACRSVNINARILIIGFASGKIPQYPVNLALLRSCSLIGVNHHHFFVTEPRQAEQDMSELLQMYRDKKISPVIDRIYPMELVGQALTQVAEARVIGKVVVSIC